MRWMSGATLVFLLATGCAQARYNQAVKAGAQAAEAGAWDEAITKYTEARDLKPSEEVDAKIVELRTQAAAQALESARKYLREGEFEKVMERLATYRRHDGDPIEISALTREVEASLLGRGSRAFQGGYHDTAYLAVIRHRKLFPESEEGETLLNDVRAHFVAAARTHRKEGRYEEAMAALKMIRDKEPEQWQILDSAEKDVKLAWADKLAGDAKAHERAGKMSEATLAFARAYSMSEHSSYRDEARRLAEIVRLKGAFVVDLQVSGPGSRASVYKEALAGATKAVPELVLASKDPALRLWVNAPAVYCKESSVTNRKTLDYVAGTIDVANPDRARIEKEIAEAERAAEAADGKASALWPKIEALREKTEKIARDGEESERARADAQRKEDMAREQAEAAEQLHEKKQAALKEAQAGESTEAELKDATSLLEQAARNLADWKAALTEARAEREKADARYDKATAGLEPAKAELEKLRATYQEQINDRDNYRKAVSTLTGSLRHAPMTVKQNVNKNHAYDEKQWTRTCVAAGDAAAQPGWKSSLDSKMKWAPERSVEDASHPGFEPAGLAPDPKAYPESDDEMVAAADAESAKAVVKWVTKLADEYYDQQRDLLDAEPLSPEGLAMYLGAPGRLDEPHKDGVRIAAKKLGIKDIDAVLTIWSY